ncbi:MAG: preprotein translocase subunit SecA, partial [Helicobacter apodemus]|nr:preprotein translocase subunit SecA [Helicobacter apodemus]
PILVGTASIEKSERIHELLKAQRIPHSVLNAKQHAQEAEIIKDAGKKGAVTIATNMAGRGVDIKIDDEVRELGGLYIIGTERHESRRIDNQLRGRSGRQGDPGTSQFYLSLEDSLLRIFGSDRIKNIMDKLGLDEGEHIESKLVTRSVESAQKKIESMHFEARKHLLEYDDVANEQRKAIYRVRNELLDPNQNITHRIIENRQECIALLLQKAEVFSNEDDLNALCGLALEDFNITLEAEALKEYYQKHNNFETYLNRVLTQAYEEKMSSLNEKTRNEIEKLIYLQTLDNLWREHLYTMDNLKTGIGLRGYNQKDPLVEYKKESFNLFLDLIKQIKYTSIK